MRWIMTSADPERRVAVSREWLLNELPKEGAKVWVPELNREVRIDRFYDHEFHTVVGAGDVDTILSAPGTAWVDHKDYVDEQARNAA